MAAKGEKLCGAKVVLGVTGGVAAYKAVELASKLTQGGASVKTIMTESACRLVGPKSFEAVTGNAVHTSMWEGEYEIGHIQLVEWADVVVIAPATANIIGKAANGICDDLLSTILCACWEKKVLIAPAMNTRMWLNPAVQRNIEKIKEMKFELIGPEEGHLACGAEGMGRMSEVGDIIQAIEKMAGKGRK